MGTPMAGSFDGGEFAAPAPPTATISPTGSVPMDEGTHTGEISEAIPTPAMTSPEKEATPLAVTETEATPATPLVISTGDPFAALSQAVQGVSSLVVTPSSIPVSATRGSRAELSSEESEEIFEDPEDEPGLGRRISESEEEDIVPPEAMGMHSPSCFFFFFLLSFIHFLFHLHVYFSACRDLWGVRRFSRGVCGSFSCYAHNTYSCHIYSFCLRGSFRSCFCFPLSPYYC